MIALLIIGGLAALWGVSAEPDHFETAMDAWERAVKKSVEDDDREEKALAIVASARKILAEEEAALLAEYRGFAAADRAYDTSEAAYELAAVRTAEAWQRLDLRMAAERRKLHALLTEAEWRELTERIEKKATKIEKHYRKKLETKE